MRRWAGPAVVAAASLVMLWWTWGTWPDVLVDFGPIVYIPWQLAEGRVLYTDIAWYFGPFSSYLNALLFLLFGPGVVVLVVANLVVLAGVIALLYRLLVEVGSRFSATLACVLLATLFAFGQLVDIGNYNFVCPYANELTHGMAFSLTAIWCLSLYLRRPRPGAITAMGLALGLAFLTKPEPFLVGMMAVAAGAGLTVGLRRPAGAQLRGLLARFTVALLLPFAICLALLSLAMTVRQALRALVGPYLLILETNAATMEFYRSSLGTLDPATNVRLLVTWAGWYAVIFVPAAVLGLALRREGIHRRVLAGTVAVIVAAVLGLNWRVIGWADAARPLPLCMLILGAARLARSLARPDDRHGQDRAIVQFSLIVFALGMLSKMILNARLYNYGFALAMPATLVLVVALVDWVPAWIDAWGGYGAVVRGVTLAVLFVTVPVHLEVMRRHFSLKTYGVANGRDHFRADVRGLFVERALEVIAKQVSPEQTLVVLPEGMTLNYFSRRRSSVPYVNFMPFNLVIEGEDRMIAAFEAHPPDYVVLVHKDTSEHGFQFFGRDYGQAMFAWIQAHYRPVTLIGAPPLQDPRFGILLLERVPPAA